MEESCHNERASSAGADVDADGNYNVIKAKDYKEDEAVPVQNLPEVG
jgi:hypothetical protein